VRIKRSDFEQLVDQGRTHAPVPALQAASIWDGEIPAPVVPSEA
jgi:hypothetical protein